MEWPATAGAALVWVAGIVLAIRTTGPSSYRHKARHAAPRFPRPRHVSARERPRDEYGRWLIPIGGSDQG